MKLSAKAWVVLHVFTGEKQGLKQCCPLLEVTKAQGPGAKVKDTRGDKPGAGRGHSELSLLWPPTLRVLEIIS